MSSAGSTSTKFDRFVGVGYRVDGARKNGDAVLAGANSGGRDREWSRLCNVLWLAELGRIQTER